MAVEREPTVALDVDLQFSGPSVITGFVVRRDQLARIDAAVARCKHAGARRMNRSRLIRIALDSLDLEALIEEATLLAWPGLQGLTEPQL